MPSYNDYSGYYNQSPYDEAMAAQREAALARQQQMKQAAANTVVSTALRKGGNYLAEQLGFGAASAPEALGAGQFVMNGEVIDAATGQAVASAAPGVGAAPGAFSFSGIGSAGNAILPLAGAAGMADVLMNKRHGARGALQGAASGAAIGSYFPGAGTLIGAGIGAGIGYFGNLGDKDRWKTEQDRAQKLRDQGINWDVPSENLTRGRTKDELLAIEMAKEAQGAYSNKKFAQSRNEADLNPEDIWGYAGFGEHYGDKWLKGMSENQRWAISKLALDSGAVQEGKGTINIDFNKIDPAELAKLEANQLPNDIESRKWKAPPSPQAQVLGQYAIVPYRMDSGYNPLAMQAAADKERKRSIALSLLDKHRQRRLNG